MWQHVRRDGRGLQFAATFDEFPPRSFPPSFNPANVLEEKMRMIRAERALREAFPMLNKPEDKKF